MMAAVALQQGFCGSQQQPHTSASACSAAECKLARPTSIVQRAPRVRARPRQGVGKELPARAEIRPRILDINLPRAPHTNGSRRTRIAVPAPPSQPAAQHRRPADAAQILTQEVARAPHTSRLPPACARNRRRGSPRRRPARRRAADTGPARFAPVRREIRRRRLRPA
jgi:hypothetical protein